MEKATREEQVEGPKWVENFLFFILLFIVGPTKGTKLDEGTRETAGTKLDEGTRETAGYRFCCPFVPLSFLFTKSNHEKF